MKILMKNVTIIIDQRMYLTNKVLFYFIIYQLVKITMAQQMDHIAMPNDINMATMDAMSSSWQKQFQPHVLDSDDEEKTLLAKKPVTKQKVGQLLNLKELEKDPEYQFQQICQEITGDKSSIITKNLNTPSSQIMVDMAAVSNEDLSHSSDEYSQEHAYHYYNPSQLPIPQFDSDVEPSYNLAKKRQELINKTHLVMNKKSRYQKKQIRKQLQHLVNGSAANTHNLQGLNIDPIFMKNHQTKTSPFSKRGIQTQRESFYQQTNDIRDFDSKLVAQTIMNNKNSILLNDKKYKQPGFDQLNTLIKQFDLSMPQMIQLKNPRRNISMIQPRTHRAPDTSKNSGNQMLHNMLESIRSSEFTPNENQQFSFELSRTLEKRDEMFKKPPVLPNIVLSPRQSMMTHGIYESELANGTPNILNKNVENYSKSKLLKSKLEIQTPINRQEGSITNLLEKISEKQEIKDENIRNIKVLEQNTLINKDLGPDVMKTPLKNGASFNQTDLSSHVTPGNLNEVVQMKANYDTTLSPNIEKKTANFSTFKDIQENEASKQLEIEDPIVRQETEQSKESKIDQIFNSVIKPSNAVSHVNSPDRDASNLLSVGDTQKPEATKMTFGDTERGSNHSAEKNYVNDTTTIRLEHSKRVSILSKQSPLQRQSMDMSQVSPGPRGSTISNERLSQKNDGSIQAHQQNPISVKTSILNKKNLPIISIGYNPAGDYPRNAPKFNRKLDISKFQKKSIQHKHTLGFGPQKSPHSRNIGSLKTLNSDDSQDETNQQKNDIKGLQITVQTANVKSINDMNTSYNESVITDGKTIKQGIQSKKETEPLNIDKIQQSINSTSLMAANESEQYQESVRETGMAGDSKRNTIRQTANGAFLPSPWPDSPNRSPNKKTNNRKSSPNTPQQKEMGTEVCNMTLQLQDARAYNAQMGPKALMSNMNEVSLPTPANEAKFNYDKKVIQMQNWQQKRAGKGKPTLGNLLRQENRPTNFGNLRSARLAQTKNLQQHSKDSSTNLNQTGVTYVQSMNKSLQKDSSYQQQFTFKVDQKPSFFIHKTGIEQKLPDEDNQIFTPSSQNQHTHGQNKFQYGQVVTPKTQRIQNKLLSKFIYNNQSMLMQIQKIQEEENDSSVININEYLENESRLKAERGSKKSGSLKQNQDLTPTMSQGERKIGGMKFGDQSSGGQRLPTENISSPQRHHNMVSQQSSNQVMTPMKAVNPNSLNIGALLTNDITQRTIINPDISEKNTITHTQNSISQDPQNSRNNLHNLPIRTQTPTKNHKHSKRGMIGRKNNTQKSIDELEKVLQNEKKKLGHSPAFMISPSKTKIQQSNQQKKTPQNSQSPNQKDPSQNDLDSPKSKAFTIKRASQEFELPQTQVQSSPKYKMPKIKNLNDQFNIGISVIEKLEQDKLQEQKSQKMNNSLIKDPYYLPNQESHWRALSTEKASEQYQTTIIPKKYKPLVPATEQLQAQQQKLKQQQQMHLQSINLYSNNKELNLINPHNSNIQALSHLKSRKGVMQNGQRMLDQQDRLGQIMRSSRYRSKLRDSQKIHGFNNQDLYDDNSPIKIDIDGGWDMGRLSTDPLVVPSVKQEMQSPLNQSLRTSTLLEDGKPVNQSIVKVNYIEKKQVNDSQPGKKQPNQTTEEIMKKHGIMPHQIQKGPFKPLQIQNHELVKLVDNQGQVLTPKGPSMEGYKAHKITFAKKKLSNNLQNFRMSSRDGSTRVDVKNITPNRSLSKEDQESKTTLDNRNNKSRTDHQKMNIGAILSQDLPFPTQSHQSKYDVGADTADIPDFKSGFSTPEDSVSKTKSIFKSRDPSLEYKTNGKNLIELIASEKSLNNLQNSFDQQQKEQYVSINMSGTDQSTKMMNLPESQQFLNQLNTPNSNMQTPNIMNIISTPISQNQLKPPAQQLQSLRRSQNTLINKMLKQAGAPAEPQNSLQDTLNVNQILNQNIEISNSHRSDVAIQQMFEEMQKLEGVLTKNTFKHRKMPFEPSMQGPNNPHTSIASSQKSLIPHYFKKRLMVTPDYFKKMSQEEILKDFRDQVISVNQANLYQKIGNQSPKNKIQFQQKQGVNLQQHQIVVGQEKDVGIGGQDGAKMEETRISFDTMFKQAASSPSVTLEPTTERKELEMVQETNMQILEVGTSPYRSSQEVVPHDFPGSSQLDKSNNLNFSPTGLKVHEKKVIQLNHPLQSSLNKTQNSLKEVHLTDGSAQASEAALEHKFQMSQISGQNNAIHSVTTPNH